MKNMNTKSIKELEVVICDFLRNLDPAEFDDEEGNGGHTRSSAIAEELSKHLHAKGFSFLN